MANTYCGKSCESCIQKEQKLCPGCHAGPGRSWSGDCEIAVCCRDKGHESCDTCTNNRYCGKRGRRDVMPDYRRREQEAEADRKEMLARQAPFMGKWLWILFWLVIPGAIAGLIGNETVVGWIPSLRIPGLVLNVLCSLAYGLILLQLSKEQEHYRTAGICCLVAAAANGISGFITGNLALLVTLPAAVVAIVGEYQEYMGHGESLSGFDRELSQKWYTLWKWYIGMFAATLGSIIVMLIAPVLGALISLAAMIGLVVVSILKLVYLYRTAKTFREYPHT